MLEKKENCYIDIILQEVDKHKEENVLLEKNDLPDEQIVLDKKSTKKEKFMTSREIYNWAESVILSLISIVLAMTFLFRINEVYGISMQPTLYEGDRLIVLPLLNSPEFGDIVVVEAKYLPNSLTGELGEPIVKRVIGVAGDTLFIDAATGEIYRNGELLDEKYIAEKIDSYHMGNQEYPLTVKENEVFVLGDNRNHSTDSRYARGYAYFVGCVKMEYVLGKASFRIWPPESIGVL